MPSLNTYKNQRNPELTRCVMFVGGYKKIDLYNNYRNDLALSSPSSAITIYNGMHNDLKFVHVVSNTPDADIVDAAKAASEQGVALNLNGEILRNGAFNNGFKMFAKAYKLTNIEELKKLAIDELMSIVPHIITRKLAAELIAEHLGLSAADAMAVVSMAKNKIEESVKALLTLNNATDVATIEDIEFSNRVTVLRAAMSQGKSTNAIAQCVELRKANPNAKIAFVSHMNTLATQFISRIKDSTTEKLKVANQHNNNLNELESADVITTTVNSIPRLMPFILNADLVVWDESEKGITATAGNHFKSTLASETSYSALKFLTMHAKRVIMMDADTSNEITGNFIDSTGITDVAFYDINTEAVYSRFNAIIDDRSVVLNNELTENLYAFDSVVTMWRTVKKLGYSSNAKGCYSEALKAGALVVCSETRKQEAVIEFIKNPNEVVRKYSKVFYSPYVGCGLSIETEYSDSIVIVSNSILTPVALVQLALRFRAVKEVRFAVAKDHISCFLPVKPTTSNEFTFKEMVELHEYHSTVVRSNVPAALFLTLSALGFNVTTVERTTDEKLANAKSVKVRNRVNAKEEAQAIADAEVVSEQVAKATLNSGKASNAEKAAATKFEIAKMFSIEAQTVTLEVVTFKDSFKLCKCLRTMAKNGDLNKLHTNASKVTKLASDVLDILDISLDGKSIVSDDAYKAAYALIKRKENRDAVMAAQIKGMGLKKNATMNNIKYMKTSINHFLKALGFICGTEGKSAKPRHTVELNPLAKRYISK
ncbi:DEAD/DEAH box helicase family protein [Vibrio vulnificus]|nr:DEAD/DEAH box helicase family protein [Vibrio vulnificus]EJE8577492.1 DEAD/DEAH box helicase family protein [Vibrio vulnificus]